MADKIRVEDMTTEIGASGTNIVQGFIEEDYRRDLQGDEGCKIYDEMRKSDATVFASLLICELPIRNTKWTIEPACEGDEETNKEIAKYVEKCIMEKMQNTWDDFLREALTMLTFGYSVFEKVWAVDDEGVYIKKLGFRKQNTIDKWLTPDGKVGITQIIPGTTDDMPEETKSTTIGIPAEKLLIFSFRKEGANFEGTSILRSAYKHRYIKDKLYKFDAVRHERQSIGIPTIYCAKGASKVDMAKAIEIVKNVRASEQTGIVMPGPKADGWLFEFADTKAGTSTNYFESINHHNREITKNVLAQFLELGNTESGSRALGESQSSMFLLSLGAVAKQIANTIDKKLIKELVDYNFDVKEYPKMKFQDLGSIDISKITTAITSFVGAGIIAPDEGIENFVRDMLELPEKAEDDGSESEGELNDLETELQDLSSDVEACEVGDEMIVELMTLSEIDSNEFVFAMPVSEETKAKISEKLKAYWSTHKKPEEIKAERQKVTGDYKSQIAGIKNQIAELRKTKTKKNGKEITAKAKTLLAQVKAIREQIKSTTTTAIGQEKKVRSDIKTAKKKVSDWIKTKQEQGKAIKEGLNTKGEFYHDGCDCHDDIFFDDKYFNELSKMIDNDYISKLQTEGNQ